MSLPNDLLMEIIKLLDSNDRQSLSTVNRRLYEAESDVGFHFFDHVEIICVSGMQIIG